MFLSCSQRPNGLQCMAMMIAPFTHEVADDAVPRRRLRISGPVYDDTSVLQLRVEYEDGTVEFVSPGVLRGFRALDLGGPRGHPSARYRRRGSVRRH